MLKFEVNIQEDDKIFGSVTLQNIMDKLKTDGYDLQKKQVNLPSGPIKIVRDDYIITVSLHSDVSVTIPIKLDVIKEAPESVNNDSPENSKKESN